MPTRKIGYRRFSGKIPLSFVEKGGTGLWLEKRWALLGTLRKMGFQVQFLSEPTEYSRHEFRKADWQECDVILIEFCSDKRIAFANDVDETCRIIGSAKPTVYLLDDPDMFTTVSRACNRFWVNAKNVPAIKQRYTSNAEYMPFAALQEGTYSEDYAQKGVYMGSPSGGREAKLLELMQHYPIDVYGSGFKSSSLDRPSQPKRYETYAKYQFSVGLRDAVHERLDWSTGRRTHSVMAGTPYIVCPDELEPVIKNRREVWQQQYDDITREREYAMNKLEELWTLSI